MSDKDIISACRPDATLKAYVIGGQSHRISIHTQQLRCVELVRALFAEGYIQENSRVAVIGGGFAGVTSAAALSASGAVVHLFEQSEVLLPLQYQNHTRTIHPSTVNWPDISFLPSTELPFLNWYMGNSHRVAARVAREFRKLFIDNQSSDEEINCRNVTIITGAMVKYIIKPEHKDGHFTIGYSDKTGNPSDVFDAIIITTGFNFEQKVSGYDQNSYWEDRSNIPLMIHGKKPNIAVVGNGDGAIIDLLRCYWQDDQLNHIYRTIATKLSADESIRNSIVEQEQQAAEADHDDLQFWGKYARFYREILSVSNMGLFLKNFDSFDCNVTLFSPGPSPFSRNSAPLNKALLGYLFLQKKFKYTPYKIVDVRMRGGPKKELNADGKYTVKPKSSPYFVVQTDDGMVLEKEKFDRVIERVGPVKEFCSLTRSLFSEAKLKKFETTNSIPFELINPSTAPAWHYNDRMGLQQARYDQATHDIRRYLEQELDFIQKDETIKVAKGGKLAVDYFAPDADLASQKPRRWYGIEVQYDGKVLRQSNMAPGFKPRNRRSFLQNSSMEGRLSELRLPFAPGQPIAGYETNDPLSSPIPRSSGVVSAFCRAVSPSGNEIFAVFPRHIISKMAARRIDAVGLDKDGNIISEPLAKVEATELDIVSEHDRRKDDFSILNDVQLAEVIDADAVDNCIAGKPVIGTKSAFYHMMNGDNQCYFDGNLIGEIDSVFNHRRLDFENSGSIYTEVFSVKCSAGTDMSKFVSGSPVHTKNIRLLGFVVASRITTREIFCVEFEKVFKKLGLEIVPVKNPALSPN